MLEARQVLPLFCGVTRLTSACLAAAVDGRHSAREFAMMHVFMTGCAREVLKVVDGDRRALHRLVTVIAGHGDMTALKWKACLLVQRQRHRAASERQPCMALFAMILPGWSCELPPMRILMAVNTQSEIESEASLVSGGHMAGRASHAVVWNFERKSRLCVVSDREGRRREPLYRMAAFAPASIRTLGELPAMRILMAIHAHSVGNWRFEITIAMTVDARHGQMLSQQRVGGPGVVEHLLETRALPGARAVAVVTSLFELALMRVDVA